jgi:hypothetical protein
MRIALVTNCTNRKTIQPNAACVARMLRARSLPTFVREWRSNLSAAHPRQPTHKLYMGRGFLEARRAWEQAQAHATAELYIASAGLGLVSATYRAPAYSITASRKGPDSVVQLLDLKDAAEWWRALTVGRHGLAARFDCADLVVVALSAPYLELLREELADLAGPLLPRLRLITRHNPSGIDPRLSRAWMPYDNRLNGSQSPIPGTESDFIQRALRHFTETVLHDHLRAGSAAHAALVTEALESLPRPVRIQRRKLSDDELRAIMRSIGPDVGAAQMLRVLRDEKNIACEQGRCSVLYKEAFAKTHRRG